MTIPTSLFGMSSPYRTEDMQVYWFLLLLEVSSLI